MNGELGDEFQMQRGLKQGCPMATLLFIIYMEPFHLKIKNTINGSRIGSERLFTSWFIDDVIVILDNEYDFTNLQNILTNFEAVTNSKINREKAKLLAHGSWSERTKWLLNWFKASQEAKNLGIIFNRDSEKTTEINQRKIINSIRTILLTNENRLFTISQKVGLINVHKGVLICLGA